LVEKRDIVLLKSVDLDKQISFDGSTERRFDLKGDYLITNFSRYA